MRTEQIATLARETASLNWTTGDDFERIAKCWRSIAQQLERHHAGEEFGSGAPFPESVISHLEEINECVDSSRKCLRSSMSLIKAIHDSFANECHEDDLDA